MGKRCNLIPSLYLEKNVKRKIIIKKNRLINIFKYEDKLDIEEDINSLRFDSMFFIYEIVP